ncbi:MAG: pyruvate, phosphate dikinase [Bacilli bacterium]|nr:pyruvate, phosphate dikinase [Bacilli bacterium]MDD4733570.1 pyruvate, phosphate dikinase [Bacilli bacterium]
MKMIKYVYSFKEGNKEMRNLLGGKGANLAEMVGIGLPVPDGFIVTTEACNKYYEDNKVISEEVKDQVFEYLEKLEQATGKKLGDTNNPLLVSVRSGSRASMPGMMDTVLNLGLNDEVVEGFAQATGNPRFTYDSYRRFIQMFADVVKGYPKSSFERLLDEIKESKGIKNDTDLTADDMKEVVSKFENVYKELSGVDFPQDPKEQLIEAITAVFRSWMNERAIIYRKMNDIPTNWGTAVNIQEMVYGNRGDDCGTGVAFTRNPATGENKLYGEYLINAQGEDVVAGIRTPQPISTLEEVMPDIYNQFASIAKKLENHYKDMQDMEFTIESGKLFMLQTRNGKRTAQAALKIAVDMVNEGMISKEEAILKVEPKQLDQLLHPAFDSESLKKALVIAEGLAASPGAANGKIYFNAEDVSNAKARGEKPILVRLETSPEDIQGMNDAQGILTLRGGMTSHAAVVARGMGRCCVSGCGTLIIDEENKTLKTDDGKVFKEGDSISLDGSTGKVYGEEIKTVEPEISGDFEIFMGWVDAVRKLKIRTNADTPKDAKQARAFGAEGIGLCRTEHMFFEEDRIFNFRKMITAETEEKRRAALDKILPFQRDDFEKLFETMEGYPVVIRYLDPPLHEFLPHTDEEIKPLADSLGVSFESLKNRVESLKEFNPMMGHRGCRLAVTYPEIAEMQTRAVIEAAINVNKKGVSISPEIMIPLTCDVKELKYVKDIVCKTADEIIKNSNVDLKYHVGTMIEIPRATILADEIAKEAEFFSFGTNDLTQMVYGFSRDDASKFLDEYYKKQIFENDPFEKLDQHGVGKLIEMAVLKGREARPDIHLGICGEHGGEPSSVEFCHRIGLDYVSCSPYRVPLARLAAAQAVIKEK